MSSRTTLENAAAGVIQHLKTIPSLADAKVAVIGGLALWKYIPDGRVTQDVDFIITIDSAPASVKKQLLELPKSPFSTEYQQFFYHPPASQPVQIDITPQWQSPYIPATAMALRSIPSGQVPYISALDLLVFKINSCGLRAEPAKRRTDARDAEALLRAQAEQGPVHLFPEQAAIVNGCLQDVVQNGAEDEAWWRRHLGLDKK